MLHMRLVRQELLERFAHKHPDAATALKQWRTIAQLAKYKITRVNDDYLNLVMRFPLRPLRTGAELNEATRIFSHLAGRIEPLSPGEKDYTDAIEQFIDAYETKQAKSLFLSANPFKTPTQCLHYLVEQSRMSVNELARVLDLTHAAASMILSGKRAISRTSAVKLSHRFCIDVSAFIS